MINLLLNGIPADTPADFSVDIQFDNPYFKKSEDYSLDIDLSLLSPGNRQIFGHIERMDVKKQRLSYTAQMQVNGSTVFRGRATIIKVDNRHVTLQLLGGTSEMNYFQNDTMIDELTLEPLRMGIPYTYGGLLTDFLVREEEHATVFGSVDEVDMVLFDQFTLEEGKADRSISASHYDVGSEIRIEYVQGIPVQPYLLRMIERVLLASGYEIGRNDIDGSWMRNLYIVNHKLRVQGLTYVEREGKATAYGAAIALPHWSLATFIDELEKFLCVIFIFNEGTVDIIDLNRYYDGSSEVAYIANDCILDEYEVELGETGEEKDVTSGNVGYNMQYTDRFLCPDPSVIAYSEQAEYDTYESLQEAFDAMEKTERNGTVFLDRSTNRQYIAYTADGTTTLKPVNLLGNLQRNSSAETDVSLNIVPADVVKRAAPVYMSYNNLYPENGVHLRFSMNQIVTTSITNVEATAGSIQELIENGETIESSATEERSVMEVAISTGQSYVVGQVQGYDQKYPLPFIDHHHEGSYTLPAMSLSLHDVCEQSIGHRLASLRRLDSGQPYVIRFLSARRPNVRAIFVIRNKRYVCRTLSVTYTHAGGSFVYEGEFFLYQ